MEIKYLVTTRAETVAELQSEGYQIVMVDGTVPNWEPRARDLHFDHHRQGGEPIQILEMTSPIVLADKICFVTTQVDADACVAACYAQLDPETFSASTYRKLTSIAFDCDHLGVPEDLSDLADFAAQCVAAMKASSSDLVKELGLNPVRKNWSIEDKELYASEAFKKGTESLLNGCMGEKFPGEEGEAAEYWEQVEVNTQEIIDKQLITFYRNCSVFDGNYFSEVYVDPRCWIKALKQVADINLLSTITLTYRKVFVDGEYKGISYTLGSIPLHPEQNKLDYTVNSYARLTEAERVINPDADAWGGRASVGGSGWNTLSNLSFEDVIDTVLETAI